jgi:hypothetical protein
VSGNIEQNVVVPYFPSPNQLHWGARYGMTVIVAVRHLDWPVVGIFSFERKLLLIAERIERLETELFIFDGRRHI